MSCTKIYQIVSFELTNDDNESVCNVEILKLFYKFDDAVIYMDNVQNIRKHDPIQINKNHKLLLSYVSVNEDEYGEECYKYYNVLSFFIDDQ